MHEAELLRSRQAVIGEMADVPAKARLWIGIAQTGRAGHGTWRKQTEQLWAGPAAADLAAGPRLKIAVQHRARRPPKRRLRGKAIDHRHVLEDVAHAITVAFTVPLVQYARQALSVRLRVPGTNQTSRDLGGCASHRFRLDRVAAEEIYLLQLGEQSRARVAARDTLHLVDGQILTRIQPIRIEIRAAVKMAGNEKNIAANTLAAGALEPIGVTPLPHPA